MELTFINVGYGEAVLMRHRKPDGAAFTALIDGGSAKEEEYSASQWRVHTADYLEEKGIKELDLLIATHFHEDHIAGLEAVMEKVRVKEFWTNCLFTEKQERTEIICPEKQKPDFVKFISSLNAYGRICQRMRRDGIKMTEQRGIKEGVLLCPGLSADILGPEEGGAKWMRQLVDTVYDMQDCEERFQKLRMLDKGLNQTSLQLRLNAGGRKAFLPGDADSLGCAFLKEHKRLLAADLIKLGHHGQKGAADAWLIEAVKPSVVVSCASSDRRYDSAHPDVYREIDRIMDGKAAFLFSDNVDLPGIIDKMPKHKALVVTLEPEGIKWRYEG